MTADERPLYRQSSINHQARHTRYSGTGNHEIPRYISSKHVHGYLVWLSDGRSLWEIVYGFAIRVKPSLTLLRCIRLGESLDNYTRLRERMMNIVMYTSTEIYSGVGVVREYILDPCPSILLGDFYQFLCKSFQYAFSSTRECLSHRQRCA